MVHPSSMFSSITWRLTLETCIVLLVSSCKFLDKKHSENLISNIIFLIIRVKNCYFSKFGLASKSWRGEVLKIFREEKIEVLSCYGSYGGVLWLTALPWCGRALLWLFNLTFLSPAVIIISQLLIINLSLCPLGNSKLAKNRVIVNTSRSLAKFFTDENIQG